MLKLELICCCWRLVAQVGSLVVLVLGFVLVWLLLWLRVLMLFVAQVGSLVVLVLAVFWLVCLAACVEFGVNVVVGACVCCCGCDYVCVCTGDGFIVLFGACVCCGGCDYVLEMVFVLVYYVAFAVVVVITFF